MDKESYIEMFKQEAKFFIDNNIANAKEYYEEVIRNLSRTNWYVNKNSYLKIGAILGTRISANFLLNDLVFS